MLPHVRPEPGSRTFVEYLLEHGLLDPAWTLSLVDTLMAGAARHGEELGFGGSEHMIRLIMRIHNDPTADDALRRQAMDLFDLLMEQFRGPAELVLSEWDRR